MIRPRNVCLGNTALAVHRFPPVAYGCLSRGTTTYSLKLCNSMSKLTYEIYGDALIATFDGSITRHNAAGFQEELAAAMGPARDAILDLSEVEDVSSSGFRMLLHVYHLAAMREGTIALVGLNDDLQYLIEATGFGEFFLVCGTLDEALRKTRNHATMATSPQ